MQPTITMMKSAPVMLRWIRLDIFGELWGTSSPSFKVNFSFKFQRSLRDLVSSQPLAASSIVLWEELYHIYIGQPSAASFNETLRVSSFKFQRSLRDLVSSQPLAASSIVGSEEGQCTARCSPKDCDVSMVFVLNAGRFYKLACDVFAAIVP